MENKVAKKRTLLSLAHEYKYGKPPEDESTNLINFVGDDNLSESTMETINERCENLLNYNQRISRAAAKHLDNDNMVRNSGRSNPLANNLSINTEVTNEQEDSNLYADDDAIFPDTKVAPLELPPLPPGHVPSYRAVFLISNAALGAGLLNFPQSYMKAGGIAISISVQLVLLVFIIGAFLIIAHCAERSQSATYQDLVLFMLGNKFKLLAQVLIALYFFGSAITYIIIIGEQLSSVITFASGHSGTWYTNKTFLFSMFAMIFLLPLCLPRRLKALSYTSFFGGIGAFFITSVVIVNYYKGNYGPNPKDPEIVTDWKSAFAAVPVICFGFQCHVSSVVVYSELKNRSMLKFIMCTLAAMVVCSLTYGLSGSFGYKTFGKSTKADILENYNDADTLVNIARISILFILLSSFAIVSFCARTVIDGFVIQIAKYGTSRADETEQIRRVTITVCWFVFVLTLAAVVPNIGVAIAMIGGVAAMFIFTFPGLCLVKSIDLQKGFLSKKEILLLVIAAMYLVVGMFIFGEVTTLAISQDIKARHIQ